MRKWKLCALSSIALVCTAVISPTSPSPASGAGSPWTFICVGRNFADDTCIVGFIQNNPTSPLPQSERPDCIGTDAGGGCDWWRLKTVVVVDNGACFVAPAAQAGRDGDCNRIADFAEHRVAPGSTTAVSPGLAPGASAALVNITMVDGLMSGYVTADRCSTLVPGPQTKSNGNHGATAAIANLSVVPLDPDGRFCLYNQVAVNLVADVAGYFAPSSPSGQVFTPSAPTRTLDTRKIGRAHV